MGQKNKKIVENYNSLLLQDFNKYYSNRAAKIASKITVSIFVFMFMALLWNVISITKEHNTTYSIIQVIYWIAIGIGVSMLANILKKDIFRYGVDWEESMNLLESCQLDLSNTDVEKYDTRIIERHYEVFRRVFAIYTEKINPLDLKDPKESLVRSKYFISLEGFMMILNGVLWYNGCEEYTKENFDLIYDTAIKRIKMAVKSYSDQYPAFAHELDAHGSYLINSLEHKRSTASWTTYYQEGQPIDNLTHTFILSHYISTYHKMKDVDMSEIKEYMLMGANSEKK